MSPGGPFQGGPRRLPERPRAGMSEGEGLKAERVTVELCCATCGVRLFLNFVQASDAVRTVTCGCGVKEFENPLRPALAPVQVPKNPELVALRQELALREELESYRTGEVTSPKVSARALQLELLLADLERQRKATWG